MVSVVLSARGGIVRDSWRRRFVMPCHNEGLVIAPKGVNPELDSDRPICATAALPVWQAASAQVLPPSAWLGGARCGAPSEGRPRSIG